MRNENYYTMNISDSEKGKQFVILLVHKSTNDHRVIKSRPHDSLYLTFSLLTHLHTLVYNVIIILITFEIT